MSAPTQPRTGVSAILENPTNPPPRTSLSLFTQTNSVALVTGAIRGIGLDIALALAETGAKVYCLDLPSEPSTEWLQIQKYVEELPELESGAQKAALEYICGDVTDQQRMWTIAEDIARKEGRIDVCVANAGILGTGDCLEYPAEEFQKVLNVNLNGVFYTAQACARQMSNLNVQGSIILMASMNGSVANKNGHWIPYNTSKAGVLQLARSMASELGSKGIRVNSVSPGYIYTQMTNRPLTENPSLALELASWNPLNRLGHSEELRGVILWLAGKGASFVTGSNVTVDGGHCAW